MENKKITDTERVLVSASKDGKAFYVWHKCRGIGKANMPIICKKEKLTDTIIDLLIEAGKIVKVVDEDKEA